MSHEHGICPIHGVQLTCHKCIAAEGGSSTSKAKAAASRANGAKGGRPKKKAKN
jgi:hypothetical protein